MTLFLRALFGAAVVVGIGLLSKSKSFFVAGLLPLFPTFTLIAQYIVGKERSSADLKMTILFGMWSMVPFLLYLLAVYFLVDRMKLESALACSASLWLVAAFVLVLTWVKLHAGNA